MDNLLRLNQLLSDIWKEKYEIYSNLNQDIIDKGLEICKIDKNSPSDNKNLRLAIAKRLVDLKTQALENELKKLSFSDKEIENIKNKMHDLTAKFNISYHEKLIAKAVKEGLLSGFSKALIKGVHMIGLAINEWKKAWQKHIIDDINANLQKRFDTLKEASEFITKEQLFMLDENKKRADRVYGALIKNGDKYIMASYVTAFKPQIDNIINQLQALAKTLKECKEFDSLVSKEQGDAYIKYILALKDAFACKDPNKCIQKWQEAEEAWMHVKSPLQVAHPLEYYDDAYTHAVSPEWDMRLANKSGIDVEKLKQQMINSFEYFYNLINANSKNMHEQVIFNIQNTQLYISSPMLFYGAELDGLFSAQVVPNDEMVSAKFGKKIFAFSKHIRAAAMARPFMRLNAEIFPAKFLDFNASILFTKPKLWHDVYRIGTIGHEFGHIFFIGTSSEQEMNKSGVFKFIEEFKATAGGLVSFFLNDDDKELAMAVFADLITRAVGLIALKELAQVRAYYCEGLIHLSLLFESGVLKFISNKLEIDFNYKSYLNFKDLLMKTYANLAKHYTQQKDAKEWLELYCIQSGSSYMPKDKNLALFVKHYYALYEAIGTQIDDSNRWQSWQEKALND